VFVDDVAEACRELKNRGVGFIKAPTDMHWGHRNADFVDTDGNIWILYKPMEKQGHNADASHDLEVCWIIDRVKGISLGG